MAFQIKLEPEAKEDIQSAIRWYNLQKIGLGKLFHQDLKARIEILKSNPHFQVRYKNYRCLPLQKYPFMIHFSVDEADKVVVIRAVFHMRLSPKIWSRR